MAPSSDAPNPATPTPWRVRPVRTLVGGVLMGFANIVPGISGGAMLLLVGIYHQFLEAIADCTRLRIRGRNLALLACIGCGAGLAILLSAGPIKDAMLRHPLHMFSLFIGLRLGAMPIVLRWARPMNAKVWAGVALGLIITAALATAQYTGAGAGGSAASTPVSRLGAGLAGASATILPGMDGSYFLMLMGEYVPILGAIDKAKEALLARDFAGVWTQAVFLLPVALGVAIGLGGVSILLRWLFEKHRAPTAGLLLGVLVGAIGGLWPFRNMVPPEVGSSVRGVLVTADNARSFPLDDWRMLPIAPQSAGEVLLSLALVALGCLIAWGFSRIDPDESRLEATQRADG